MRAVLTIQNKDGTYDEVGTMNRSIVGPATSMKSLITQSRAVTWGRPARLEIYNGTSINGDPKEVKYLDL